MISTFIQAEMVKKNLSQKREDGLRKTQLTSNKSSGGKENIPHKMNKKQNSGKSKIPGPINQNSSKKYDQTRTTKSPNKPQESHKLQERGIKAKPAPNFDKLHQKWDEKLQKGKVTKKKPLTQINAFNFERNYTTSTKKAVRSATKLDKEDEDFTIDPDAYKSIFNDNIGMVKNRPERNTIAVPKARSQPVVKNNVFTRASFLVGQKLKSTQAGEQGTYGREFDKTSVSSSSNKDDMIQSALSGTFDGAKVPVRKGVIREKQENINSAKNQSSLQGSKLLEEFQPDPNSLKAILENNEMGRAPAKSGSLIGSVKRKPFGSIVHSEAYKENRGSIYYNEKYERTRQMSFADQLAEVLNNSRPSNAAPQKSQNGLHCNDQQQTPVPRTSFGVRNSFYAARPNIAKNRHQSPRNGSEKKSASLKSTQPVTPTASSQKQAPAQGSAMPKPRIPGQLCEVNYISPRRGFKPTSHQKNARSPKSNTGGTPVQNLFTTPQKTPKSGFLHSSGRMKLTPARMTNEARYNLSQGLPLPENPYEYMDLSSKKETSLHSAVTNTGEKTLNLETNDTNVSSSKKKSVRWADVFDKKNTAANRELIFPPEETKPQDSRKGTPKEGKLTEISNLPRSSHLEESFVGKILRNIDAWKGQENALLFADTILTTSIQQPKMSHLSSRTENAGIIPKPFLSKDRDVISATKIYGNDLENCWENITPETEARDGHNQSNVTIPSCLKTFYVDQTPEIDSSFLLAMPGCPRARRTWARTPHADKGTERNNETLDCTVNDVATSYLTSKDSKLNESKQIGVHLPKALTTSSENTSLSNYKNTNMDKPRNILVVLHEINEMSITDDIKRVKSREQIRCPEQLQTRGISAADCTALSSIKSVDSSCQIQSSKTSENFSNQSAFSRNSSSHSEPQHRSLTAERLKNCEHILSNMTKNALQSSRDTPLRKESKPLSKGEDVTAFFLEKTSAFRKVSVESNVSVRSAIRLTDCGRKISVELPAIEHCCSDSLLDSEMRVYTKYFDLAQRLGKWRTMARNCPDPVASILTHGDDRHFIPITEDMAR